MEQETYMLFYLYTNGSKTGTSEARIPIIAVTLTTTPKLAVAITNSWMENNKRTQKYLE